jgi:hypothetical protein
VRFGGVDSAAAGVLEGTARQERGMTSTAATQGAFDLARVIKHTFGAIRRNAATFAILALLLAGAPAALSTFGLVSMVGRLAGPAAPDLTGIGVGAMLAGAGGLISLVANAVLQGAIIYGTASYLNGRAASFGDCLGAGLRRCLPLIGLMILMILALMVGAVLLLVPAVMMGVAWIAAVPALVVERTGVFGAFGRSADLTRGRRWPIFGLLILYSVVVGVVQQSLLSVVRAAFVAATPAARLVDQLPVSAAISVLVSVLSSAGMAAIYYELRSTREGVGPEAFAAVFD